MKKQKWYGLWVIAQKVFLAPIDDDSTNVIMAWPSREEAELGADYQSKAGFLDEGDWEIREL